ncbi:MAG: hypothetical protein L3K15_08225 [Thermoplasmata archaeon]|nr:hypothetical protein [Thermoplasmata archaeon]
MVALTAWVGIRRREAWSLRCGDVNLGADSASISVVRKGGERKMLPIPQAALNVVRPAVFGPRAEERVHPLGLVSMDKDLGRVGARLGIRVG